MYNITQDGTTFLLVGFSQNVYRLHKINMIVVSLLIIYLNFAMIKAMRSGFIIMLLVTVLFAGGYFYYIAQAVCPVPITYRVGELDERFGLSLDEAKVAIADAAELWEEATGQNLFSYDEDAKFVINFQYDERQAYATAEEILKDRLEAAENINEALSDTYAQLVAEYNKTKLTYADRVEKYERRLVAYNQKVQDYNEQGGAPSEVYADLEAEKDALDRERTALNDLSAELNELVGKINDVGDRGNALIANYNENVGVFNEKFGETREFTQGDYNYERINIYTYKDKQELETVLAHELGHALSLDHVEGSSSIMYYLIGEQPAKLDLSETDLAEFNRICGDMNLWDKIVYRLTNN